MPLFENRFHKQNKVKSDLKRYLYIVQYELPDGGCNTHCRTDCILIIITYIQLRMNFSISLSVVINQAMCLQSKSVEYIIVLKVVIFTILNANRVNVKDDSLIYILSWKKENTEETPFTCRDRGRETFINKHCLYQNCFYTSNRSYFNDVREFDIILFNVMHYYYHNPPRRSDYQRYVFLGLEPASKTTIPKVYQYKHFFNMTATYKLNSNIPMRNFVIRNKKGEIIGPNTNMNWKSPKKMKPTSDYVKSKLRHKKIAAVWMSSRCNKHGKNEKFIFNLRDELLKYNLKLDIFGKCGHLKCKSGLDGVETCEALVESDYYFFLAFEDHMDDDYVTKKLMVPLLHYSVPVVYGGANYTRCV